MSEHEDIPDEVLAGEYVLGVLDAEEAARRAARGRIDPAFDALVRDWERRLMPAAALVQAVPPPPGLLRRIEAAMRPDLDGGVAGPVLRGLRRQLWVWRGLTAGSLAVACGLLALLLARPGGGPTQVAVLLPPGTGSGGFLVRQVGGGFQIEPVRPPAVPSGRNLQLWSLPAGATAPRSLGVLPGGGETLPPGAVPDGDVQLLVSLEPAGGSPSGAPTGPVVLATELRGRR